MYHIKEIYIGYGAGPLLMAALLFFTNDFQFVPSTMGVDVQMQEIRPVLKFSFDLLSFLMYVGSIFFFLPM